MPATLTLENVTISYDRHPAVHHLSGVFAPGSLTALAGPNGAGKSTLLKAIAGILPVESGRILIGGALRKDIAYMPQAAGIERDFPLSVQALVATGFWRRAGGFGSVTPRMKAAALQALETVGLRGLGEQPLSALSAGQFQRALFARIIVQDAPLILLDEPFNAIDSDTTEHLLGLVKSWHAQGRTVICVLHDFDQIRENFPRCLLLAREAVAWDDSARALSPENLLKARFLRDPRPPSGEPCGRVA